jgi:hypothetical protein
MEAVEDVADLGRCEATEHACGGPRQAARVQCAQQATELRRVSLTEQTSER